MSQFGNLAWSESASDVSLPNMLNRTYWVLPAVAVFLVLIWITLSSFNGWSWAHYDELSWVASAYGGTGAFERIARFFSEHGRIQVVAVLVNFLKLKLLGFDPRWLRLERVLELMIVGGLSILVLRQFFGVAIGIAAVSVVFWLRSFATLDVLQYMTTGEIYGLVLVLLGILSLSRSKALAYFFLTLAALTKEPMAIFLLLPGLLFRSRRELLASGMAILSIFVFLWLNRRNYTAGYGLAGVHFGAARTYFLIAFEEYSWMLAALIVCRRGFQETLRAQREMLWKATVFVGMALFYLMLIFPKVPWYGYILTPVLLFLLFGMAILLEAWRRVRPLSKFEVVALVGVAVYFTTIVNAYWARAATFHSKRTEAINFVRSYAERGRVGSNANPDGAGFGWHFLRGESGPLPSASVCDQPGQKVVEDCCRDADTLVFGPDGSELEAKVHEAQVAGLPVLMQNGYWFVFKCR